MKIDKKNIRHWFYLIMFGLNVMAAIALRPLRGRKAKPQLLLYGHKLSGNLLALYEHIRKSHQTDFEIAFLTMDAAYHQALVSEGVTSVLVTRPQGLRFLIKADAIISDHGLHVMSLLLTFSGLKFFDVWHGIPFKGFDAKDFRIQQRYSECWVASPLMAKMYVERFGFNPDQVRATGYGRTDQLVRQDKDVVAIKHRFGLTGADVGKIVLFAPTWKQDAQQRSIFPFGMDEQTFVSALSDLAVRTNSTFVMRAHLNSGNGSDRTWQRIVQRPHAQYPDTEALLLISDMLVCDWSSIAFDYLLLDRPTLFLDVEAPFAKRLSLDASYRYGPIIQNMSELLQLLQRYLNDPAEYAANYSESAKKICADVYGSYADGEATARYVERLQVHSVGG